MTTTPEILCVGSVLWDVIGRSAKNMRQGSDVPGRITRLPGGVALNIAMTLRRFGMRPALLSAVGCDPEGDELIAACAAMGLITDYVYRSEDRPTDRYMAVEGANGVIAAIADAHSLEAAGDKILQAVKTGPLGTSTDPFQGIIALDGNLTAALLKEISRDPDFAGVDLRVAPASPGKADRLMPFVTEQRGLLYVNREEAGLMCQTDFADSQAAAAGMLDRGARRVLVTDGSRSACDGALDGLITLDPPCVSVARVTGAGDTFMAAHIVAELGGADRTTALQKALNAAASYVSGGTGL